ncbi:MAG: O-methyltransferase, partial [Bacilli bacterium]|nr:O-methyltransferase [Bacilli bacterium]
NLNVLPNNKVIKEMRKYVETNKVPVINDEALAFIMNLIDIQKPKKVLEIGTAIGFFAINIATYNEDLVIDTIERNELMFSEALKNIKKAKLDKRINAYLGDASDFDSTKLKNEYDLIFIDGPKAQYINFFEKYEKLLADEGIILSDNLLFHGFVNNTKGIATKNLLHLVEKIENYNSFLAKNKNYQTYFFSIGDGIAVTRRKKK